MVLAQLGLSILLALQKMNDSTIIDERVLNECLNEITRALLASDVQFQLVRDMQTNIEEIVNLDDLASGHNKRKIIEQAIFNELCKMLHYPFTPKKQKNRVVMLVGLHGSGTTRTCTKYASHHQKKGWRPALVCVDRFTAGDAFDQLQQNVTEAKIRLYGSYTESDPVKIAVDGVERSKKENCDLIIVDTSGRHQQEAALFEELRQVSEAIKPALVILVMDSSIGQAAFDEAQAFKQSVSFGAVIVTKMDGNAKGGGALSGVAAAKSPVIFMGTGEHMDDFEVFDVKPFVSRLLGMGDWSGFMDKIHEVVPVDQQLDLLRKLSEGNFTLRFMYKQFQNVLKMGRLCQVFAMLLGLSTEWVREGESLEEKIEHHMAIILWVPEEALDGTAGELKNKCCSHIAQGSSFTHAEVAEMFEECERLGTGDWSAFMDKIREVFPVDQPEVLRKLLEGNFTLRIYKQFLTILQIGPLFQVFAMLPGFSTELVPEGRAKESLEKIKRHMTMMDSMTRKELDSTSAEFFDESRVLRIAKGSGRAFREVEEMLEEYKRLGMGDQCGFVDKICEVFGMEQLPEVLKKISQENLTLRIMYELFQNILEIGRLFQVFAMLPGFSIELVQEGRENESLEKIKRHVTMMDSMTGEELDSTNPKLINESRMTMIGEFCGFDGGEVKEMLEGYELLGRVAYLWHGWMVRKKLEEANGMGMLGGGDK